MIAPSTTTEATASVARSSGDGGCRSGIQPMLTGTSRSPAWACASGYSFRSSRADRTRAIASSEDSPSPSSRSVAVART